MQKIRKKNDSLPSSLTHFEHLPFPYAVLSTKLKILDSNAKWKSLFYKNNGDNPPLNYQAYKSWYNDKHEKVLRKILNGKDNCAELNCSISYRNKRRWYHCYYTSLKQDLEIKNILVIITDITSFIAKTSEQHQLAKLMTLGQLSCNLAHEINNPLSVIRMNAEMLMTCFEDERNISRLEKIIRTTDRISGIVRALKSIGASKVKPLFAWTSVQDIISDVHELCALRMKDEEVHFSTQYDSSVENKKYFVESTHLSQALINLINNALDAIEGLEKKWIKVIVYENSKNLIIQVIDSGDGITPGVLQSMKEKFFSTKPKGKGLGLGLSLTKTYVATHGGSIAYTPIDKHTAFTIMLPLSKICSPSKNF